MRKRTEDGYASVTAIILCAALSLLCAGVLSVVIADKKQAQRQMFRTQQMEAINTAMLHLGADIVKAQGDTPINKDEAVIVPGGQMTVTLRAENEGRKWPLAKFDEVDEALVKQHIKSGKDGLPQGLGGDADTAPKNDCLRSLFSIYGSANTKQDLTNKVGVLAMSGGHDGQVWRLRAVTGNRLEERQVRFLGDQRHLFAVISQEDFALGEMPTCTQLIQ